MRIGVLADNHRLIDPALPALLAGVDEIWHAGDMVTPDILGVLGSLAPVQAVRGNNDVGPAFADLPEELILERSGVRVLIRHIVGPAARIDREARASIARQTPQVVVMGHSHRPRVEIAAGVVYLNPGSCGPRRFSLPRSAGILELTPSSLRFTVIDLDGGHALIDTSFELPAPSPPLPL
jgi:putative phosphoesterase